MSHPLPKLRAKPRKLPPNWGPHHDNRLRDTAGKYAAIAALSDEWGVASSALVSRLHRLRAEGGVASTPEHSPGPAEVALNDSLSGSLLAMIRAMEARGEVTNDDLARDLGKEVSYLSTLRSKAAARLHAVGWRIAWRGGGRLAPRVYWLERIE